ncbi:MAG: DUF2344 domain-containing protein [Candidatus Melainabacteria bacterium]|nr:DUF2344 domain-containing protein [Candidatus Melainabacteria bacterium]
MVPREELLHEIARQIPGVYVPRFYKGVSDTGIASPIKPDIPERIVRQTEPLTDANQPEGTLVPYLSLVHDRQVLEVRRGCDRGCRFCQPGYTFLPVRERSSQDLVRLSKQVLSQSGYEEYSLLGLCVSDYTSLHEATIALNEEHGGRRVSMSLPSQRADRMNCDIAHQLKVVRKSTITLAPEAGTERLRRVINKGLRHNEIIAAIETAYQSGWAAVKLYFILGLPTETDDDLLGIIGILQEATERCAAMRQENPARHRRMLELTCTISNFVPKPFTPFQWFGQISPEETIRRQNVLKSKLKELGLRKVNLNFTRPHVSLLEAVISRGNRTVGEIIYRAWQLGCKFDAWEEKFNFALWDEAALTAGQSLRLLACTERDIGVSPPWEIVHVGLSGAWLEGQWSMAVSGDETEPCTQSVCHGCGICTQLATMHVLANPKQQTMSKNPFIKELPQGENQAKLEHCRTVPRVDTRDPDMVLTKIRFEFTKTGELRFISHLDLQHLLIRAARRAQLSVLFSQGFNPSPKLSLAVPLPLFEESVAEIAEIELSQAITADEFVSSLNRCLPPEVQVRRAKPVQASQRKTAIASVVGRALYQATPSPSSVDYLYNKYRGLVQANMAEKVATMVSSPALYCQTSDCKSAVRQVPRDIKPGVFSLKVLEVQPLTLEFELATLSNLHVRPADLLRLIEPEIIWRVTRLSLATADGIPLFDFSEKGAL